MGARIQIWVQRVTVQKVVPSNRRRNLHHAKHKAEKEGKKREEGHGSKHTLQRRDAQERGGVVKATGCRPAW